MATFRRGVLAPIAAAATLSLSALAAHPGSHEAFAASSLPKLLATAEHNTNTVRTLVHHDQLKYVSSTYAIASTTVGEEDEVRNRESDSESVTITGRGKTNAGKSRHYTLDVIFVNGKTYYRTTLVQSNKWLSKSGTTLQDPVLSGEFKRARTTVSFPSVSFAQSGTSGGQTEFTGHVTNAKQALAGTVTVTVSSGSTPMIIQEVQDYHSTKSGGVTEHEVIRFGPYNSALVILAPTSSGTT